MVKQLTSTNLISKAVIFLTGPGELITYLDYAFFKSIKGAKMCEEATDIIFRNMFYEQAVQCK